MKRLLCLLPLVSPLAACSDATAAAQDGLGGRAQGSGFTQEELENAIGEVMAGDAV